MLSSGMRAMAATPAAREAAAAPYSRLGGMPRAPTARGSSAGAAARAVGASGMRSLLRAWVRPMASSSSSTGSSFSTSRRVSPACSSLDSRPRREACSAICKPLQLSFSQRGCYMRINRAHAKHLYRESVAAAYRREELQLLCLDQKVWHSDSAASSHPQASCRPHHSCTL
eukprot:5168-Heterococcus_DN1.PRE.6